MVQECLSGDWFSGGYQRNAGRMVTSLSRCRRGQSEEVVAVSRRRFSRIVSKDFCSVLIRKGELNGILRASPEDRRGTEESETDEPATLVHGLGFDYYPVHRPHGPWNEKRVHGKRT